MKKRIQNELKLYILVILLGVTTGAVLWCFLKAVSLCTEFLWAFLPESTGAGWLPILFCTAGGLATGLIHRKYGNYPEELQTVIGKIKRDKHYDYKSMPVLLICAFLPLVLGASVGPEAGLTGVIAGLCYWIGDNVKYAKEHAEEYSEIGAAVTLAGLFHIPLFGIFAVEENAPGEDNAGSFTMPKITKLLLYGLSIASAFLVMRGLGNLFGPAGEGFPSFEASEAGASDYLMMLLYMPAGLLLFFAFEYAEKLVAAASKKLPVIARETICGLGVGLIALAVPEVLFSGESQMGMLPDTYASYAPAALVGICLLKVFMTAFCIELGLRGGHFFPLIFACSCMGFGIAMLVFTGSGATALTDHAVFAAAVITATTLGAQMKKPLAVSMLLLICFPIRLILWIFVAAALGGKIGALIEGAKGNSDEKQSSKLFS